MNQSKLIILAWLLLLIPTLLLGIGAIRLMQNEEARLLSSNRAAAEDRIAAVAGNIDLAVAEVQDGLLQTLRNLPQNDLIEQLDNWQRSNPLIRNAFVWQPGGGLLWPNPEQPASEEEAAFIRRYLPLFSGLSEWEAPVPEMASVDGEPQTETAAVRTVFAQRKELRELAQQYPGVSTVAADSIQAEGLSPILQAEQQGSASGTNDGDGGWRSWYADDQLHLIGWFAAEGTVQNGAQHGNRRYGVEMEMMALLSRLLQNLPASPAGGESFALIDGNGAIFHQAGSFEVLPESRALASQTISSLPHWKINIYIDPTVAASSNGVVLLGSLLIGTFIAAILLGGSLLLWQAHKNQRDARRKTSFVSNVSHELKTPLTTIRMYAEMLGEGNIQDPEKQARYLRTIIKESQRLTRLVGNVLDFSRLEQGRRSYRNEEINLVVLLNELLDRQQLRLEEAGLQLTRDFELGDDDSGHEPLILCSDCDALEQIILNLLDNAIKYAAEGERLEVTLERMDDRVRLQFRDHGPGIPAAHRRRIFDKFHRVDNSLTTRQQGSGLGLSIGRQLAQGLGGTLSCCPVEGQGSCFELTLPHAPYNLCLKG
ncbi:MAG: HAMP domain-containing histidine kinase [Desulfuromonas sp.]|nr:HAMP domain-containing histidine kinase [Desulfuromonas sp.]